MHPHHPHTPVLGALLASLLAGCSTEEVSPWKLVGVYDASAVIALEADPEAETPDYHWTPPKGMTASCGPAKAPDGLGVFEAEAIANRLSPTLAIVLERTELAPEGPLYADQLRVALGDGAPSFLLQPLREPRYISVSIQGEGELRYKQLIRTQLQMELCLEHKTGRGWIGGKAKQLRQAFLLDRPDKGGPDRKYFGGQTDPVPALLAPPDACLQRADDFDAAPAVGGKGEGSLDLVPSDIWGASLRWCEVDEQPGSRLSAPPRPIPLSLSELGESPAPRPSPSWTGLAVEVYPGDEEQVTVSLRWGEQQLLDHEPLFSEVQRSDGRVERGILDLLARVPYTYPTVGPRSDPDRYAVLLVPNWQLVEGLRRLAAGSVDEPRPSGGRGVLDGVGYVLEHPELLFVQVPQPGGDGESWLNLSDILSGGPWGLRQWGYTVGMMAGRSPIVLPSQERPSWQQEREAQRAAQQGLVVGAFAILAGLLILGLRRLPDLWTEVPEERVDYWPGSAAEEDVPEGESPAAPEGGGGKEGEK